MNWETPLLFGFFLLFSACIAFPINDDFSFIDSQGVKHHVLAPISTDSNNVNDITNVLFTRYENPWIDYAGINIIFVAGIIISIRKEPARLYLSNRTWGVVTNLEKYFQEFLQKKSTSLVYKKQNKKLLVPCCLNFTVGRLTKSTKFFFIFVSVLILISSSHNAYAALANFVDGNQFTDLSTNCNARSTVATLSTSLPAASNSNPNIIIATTDFVSSDSQIETVDLSSGLYRGTTILSQPQYNFYIAKKDQGTSYTYLYEDPTAPANPTYTIQACLSATAGNAESKIVAIQGLESSFYDSGNVSTTPGSFATIATLTTDLTANDHIIIAQVQIDFDGEPIIAPGDIELRDNSDVVLSENQFELRGQDGTFGDGSSIILVAVVPTTTANALYKVMVREPSGGGLAGAEAKILAIKANGGQAYFSDGASVPVGASSTQLTSLTSGFTSNQKILVLSSSQFDDTNGRTEKLDQNTGHEIRENSIAKSGNQMAIGERTGAGQAGEGLRHTLIWYGTVAGPSLGYDSRADASSAGYLGESKLLAFSIHQDLFPSDTPVLTDGAIVQLQGAIIGSDTPTLTDSALVNQNLFQSDTPTLSDGATVQLTSATSGSDTPTLTESVLIHQNLFPTDSPSLFDSFTIQQTGTANGNDTPILSDGASIQISGAGGIDTPILNDNANILKFRKRGSSGDMEAPQFVGKLLSSEFGGIIDRNNPIIPPHSQTIPTNLIKTGEEIQLKLLIFDNSGISSIQHVALYINLREPKGDVENSNTYLVYEKGEIPLQIIDPEGFFSNVGLKISPNEKDLELTFYLTFAKAMEKSDMIFRLWDVYRNSKDTIILDAIEVIASTNKETVVNPEPEVTNEVILFDLIKAWGGYGPEKASDLDLLKYFGIDANYLPSWVKKNYPQWVLSGQVSIQEFIDAIEYLHESGIIR